MVSMISTIAFYIGITILSMIGLLLVVGATIATVALIDFWSVYGKLKAGEEVGESQDLKKEIKSLEQREQELIDEKIYEKPHVDTTHARGFFGKLHDISIMALWVVMSAIWYVAICIIGFVGWICELLSACFKKKSTI